jgi:SAM-dependent methyltransferase
VSEYDERFYRSIGDEGVATARVVLPIIFELLGPCRSVLDLGCGVGSWLSVCQELGVARVHGVDGDYVPRDQLRIPVEDFEAADLSTGYVTDERFDLAMSLEVAEHLPGTAARGFARSLTAAAPAVLFSAAVPGQGGTGHVNEQWPDYWADIFESEGYVTVDAVRPETWGIANISTCIRQNVLLYVRTEVVEASELLTAARDATRRSQLAIVHPQRYELVAQPRQMSVGRLVRSLPASALATARRRAGKGRARTNH